MVDSTTTNPHHCRWLNTPPSGAVSENVSLRRFSGPLVSYPSADSGHGLLQHHLEKYEKVVTQRKQIKQIADIQWTPKKS
jgi:hypothetical protein